MSDELIDVLMPGDTSYTKVARSKLRENIYVEHDTPMQTKKVREYYLGPFLVKRDVKVHIKKGLSFNAKGNL